MKKKSFVLCRSNKFKEMERMSVCWFLLHVSFCFTAAQFGANEGEFMSRQEYNNTLGTSQSELRLSIINNINSNETV